MVKLVWLANTNFGENRRNIKTIILEYNKNFIIKAPPGDKFLVLYTIP